MKKIDKVVSIFTIIFLVLLLIKICGLFEISWIIVVAPLWVPTAVVAFLSIIANVAKLILKPWRGKRR